MIIGVFGASPDAESWLAEVGARWRHADPRGPALLGHTGGAGESQFVGGDLALVCASRLARRSTSTDAEEIAATYRAFGPDCARRLAGFFAFVLYDARTRALFATSSLTSRRPLAYWCSGGTVVVGSRLLPLLRHPRAPRPVLDDDYVGNVVLGYAVAPAGTSPFEKVHRLRAGFALAGTEGNVRPVRVDNLSVSPKGGSGGPWDVEEFWEALGVSIAGATRGVPRWCVSLSGGLDSAAVASAALDGASQVSAFSLVSPSVAPDEKERVDALTRSWASVSVQYVDCSADIAYPDLSSLPLRDDPTVLPLSLLAARLRLWRAMRSGGFVMALDGEGGDELFQGFVTAVDAFRAGSWSALARHLRARPDRRSIALRAFVLPWMPAAVRRHWVRKWARPGTFLPSYLSPGARWRPAYERANAVYYERRIQRPARELVEDWLSWPTGVAAVGAHDQFAAGLGVELVSPLLDRRVVELVLALPAGAKLPMGPEEKRFLRTALVGRLPERLRTRAKDERLADELGVAVLTSAGARAAVVDARARSRFEQWICFDKLQELLGAVARGHRPSPWVLWQLECAVTLCEWYGRASREYGVD